MSDLVGNPKDKDRFSRDMAHVVWMVSSMAQAFSRVAHIFGIGITSLILIHRKTNKINKINIFLFHRMILQTGRSRFSGKWEISAGDILTGVMTLWTIT